MSNKCIYTSTVPSPTGTGRPRLVINEAGLELVKKLAMLHATRKEIAAVMGVSDPTIGKLARQKAYAEAYQAGLEMGRVNLRRMQWKKAEDGNVAMLIWLGKQILGQSDKSEVVQSEGDKLVKITVVPASKAPKDVAGNG